MSVIISAPAVTPAPVFPYRFSALWLFRSDRRLDPHAFMSESDHGGLEWQPEPCVLEASTFSPQVCLSEEHVTGQYIQRPSQTAEPRWFESAAARSTLPGCPSLEDAVTKALQAKIATAIDAEIAGDLEAGVVVLGTEGSVVCAVAAAVATLAGVAGDGRGIITLPPDAVAVLSATPYFQGSGSLVDVFGNVYVVNGRGVPGRIYAESQAAYEVFVSDPDFRDQSDRNIREDSVALSTNTEVLSGQQAYLLLHSNCGIVSAVDYSCLA